MHVDKQEVLVLFGSAKNIRCTTERSPTSCNVEKIKQYSLNQCFLTVIYAFSLRVNSPAMKKVHFLLLRPAPLVRKCVLKRTACEINPLQQEVKIRPYLPEAVK